jgi:predicted  nucleic acid-binding Zn-ribbon protein
MFVCERCGSRYSAMRAAAMENCPRCTVRDHTAAPLAFKAFRLPPSAEMGSADSRHETQARGREPVSA